MREVASAIKVICCGSGQRGHLGIEFLLDGLHQFLHDIDFHLGGVVAAEMDLAGQCGAHDRFHGRHQLFVHLNFRHDGSCKFEATLRIAYLAWQWVEFVTDQLALALQFRHRGLCQFEFSFQLHQRWWNHEFIIAVDELRCGRTGLLRQFLLNGCDPFGYLVDRRIVLLPTFLQPLALAGQFTQFGLGFAEVSGRLNMADQWLLLVDE